MSYTFVDTETRTDLSAKRKPSGPKAPPKAGKQTTLAGLRRPAPPSRAKDSFVSASTETDGDNGDMEEETQESLGVLEETHVQETVASPEPEETMT